MAAGNNGYDWWPDCFGINFTEEDFVMIKGRTGKIFHVHKEILVTSGSPVLEEIFSASLSIKSKVVRTEDNPEDFELLLKFLYGKCDRLTSAISVWKLYQIGEKYQVPNILEACMQYIQSIELSEEEFYHHIEYNLSSHPLVYDKITAYIKEKAESIINSEKFLTAPEKFVDRLLKMDELNFDEYDLLLAVTEWGYRNISQPNSEKFIKFYKHIRFGTLTYSEFLRFNECYPNAIDEKNVHEIKMYLHSISVRYLPDWCSENHVPRKNTFLLVLRKKLAAIEDLYEDI